MSKSTQINSQNSWFKYAMFHIRNMREFSRNEALIIHFFVQISSLPSEVTLICYTVSAYICETALLITLTLLSFATSLTHSAILAQRFSTQTSGPLMVTQCEPTHCIQLYSAPLLEKSTPSLTPSVLPSFVTCNSLLIDEKLQVKNNNNNNNKMNIVIFLTVLHPQYKDL